MGIDIHVYSHSPETEDLRQEVRRGFRDLRQLILEVFQMAQAELDALTAQVQANSDAESSAVTLIQGLATLIQSNQNNPGALADLTKRLKASADSLAAAVVQNTPAAGGVAPGEPALPTPGESAPPTPGEPAP